MVAPPNGGSLEALDQLVKGFSEAGPLVPDYPAALLGTYTSIYQLLPRPRHGRLIADADISKKAGDFYDPAFWQQRGWGLSATDKDTDKILQSLLPDIDSLEARRGIAREYQTKALRRAEQFHKALDAPAQRPEGIDLFLVAGDTIATPQQFSLDSQTADLSLHSSAPGDDIVTRSSALLDERIGGEWEPRLKSPIQWDSVLFISGLHRNITSHPTFSDNVLYWLLEDPR